MGARSANQTVDRNLFVGAMRRAASGVTVVTTDGPAGRSGATVSAMCSVAADPPSLLDCIQSLGRTARAISKNGRFCVNVLAESHHEIADIFAGRRGARTEEHFDSDVWRLSTTGAPMLIGSTASFQCRVARAMDYGSHCIYIGNVADVMSGDGIPLVYTDARFCRIAPFD